MLRPLPASQWNVTAAAHLLNRAGFGGSPAEVAELEALGLERAVRHLVDYEDIPDPTPRPEWAQPDPAGFDRVQALPKAGEEERRQARQAEQRLQQGRLIALRHWWVARMVQGPRPLQEKLTLFWHGHFATGMQKVKDAYYLWLQNDSLRRHASGNWLDMLVQVSKDPAMLIWLDQAQSRRQGPNENYARELMERFTLGEGHYSEEDVQQAARAFTGLTLNRREQTGAFRVQAHDPGVKTVLGRTGRLTWLDVLEQIVAQPQAARFIVANLCRFFMAAEPTEAVLTALTQVFRQAGNSFKPVLRALFLSEEFYSAHEIRNQVKSPVQWLVGSLRLLEREVPEAPVVSQILADLGQELFAPPNLEGWEEGLSWITTNTLWARYNHAAVLVYGRERIASNLNRRRAKTVAKPPQAQGEKPSPVKVRRLFSAKERSGPDALLEALARRFLQSPLRPKQREALREYLDAQAALDDQDILETIRLLMSTPEYQLT